MTAPPVQQQLTSLPLEGGGSDRFAAGSYPLPLGNILAAVVPLENKPVVTVALVLSALGLRASLLDFFCPLAMSRSSAGWGG
jgi:hypothetical protein